MPWMIIVLLLTVVGLEGGTAYFLKAFKKTHTNKIKKRKGI